MNGTRYSAFQEFNQSRKDKGDYKAGFARPDMMSSACTDGSNSPTVRLNR